MTRNTKLIKTMNRLDYNISQLKLCKVGTVNALQKLSRSSSFAMKETTKNTERLGKTLSGASTTLQVNSIRPIKRLFVQRLLAIVNITKIKKLSISVQPIELPFYNVGVRPESSILLNTNKNLSFPMNQRLLILKEAFFGIFANICTQTTSSLTVGLVLVCQCNEIGAC